MAANQDNREPTHRKKAGWLVVLIILLTILVGGTWFLVRLFVVPR
jgi:hypothetical protein